MAEPVPTGSDVSAGTYRCTNCGESIDVCAMQMREYQKRREFGKRVKRACNADDEQRFPHLPAPHILMISLNK